MPRSIWKGRIAFGLVSVPVSLQSAEQKNEIHLQMLDSRNSAPVRFRRVNESTGEEVPWEKIVKGYKFSEGNYVLLSDEELDRVGAELTRTVEIEKFVELAEIEPMYFDRPYYLVPEKGGEKGYFLLHEAMQRTGRVGIARVVIHTREYLAAMLPVRQALVLNLLRFHDEIRAIDDLELPDQEADSKQKIRAQVLDLAIQLIGGMSEKWVPADFHDRYHKMLMDMIQQKAEAGQLQPLTEVASSGTGKATGPVINLMDALKRSLAKSQPKQAANSARRSPRRSGKKRAS
jgi:DNA end-binding protein Ku